MSERIGSGIEVLFRRDALSRPDGKVEVANQIAPAQRDQIGLCEADAFDEPQRIGQR